MAVFIKHLLCAMHMGPGDPVVSRADKNSAYFLVGEMDGEQAETQGCWISATERRKQRGCWWDGAGLTNKVIREDLSEKTSGKDVEERKEWTWGRAEGRQGGDGRKVIGAW